ncbi:MAG: hypothetical protein WCO81_14060 [Cyanobacteriota bacterium ELA615]
MIHHFSIAAEKPLQVARALAKILQGKVYTFPHLEEGYMVMTDDAYGTGVEVYPLGTELRFSPGHPNIVQTKQNTNNFGAFHASISVPVSQEELIQIGNEEGWHVQLCQRKNFAVIEFWIENFLMLELLPPDLSAKYLAHIKSGRPEKFKEVAVV